ncbi:MAG: hypothetical protein ABSG23_07585 [Terriglobales bacterium]|jgi:hypothetical protein
MTEYVGAIEKQILENTYFRRVLFTAEHAQLLVMWNTTLQSLQSFTIKHNNSARKSSPEARHFPLQN